MACTLVVWGEVKAEAWGGGTMVARGWFAGDLLR
jgi:hypothetical protein